VQVSAGDPPSGVVTFLFTDIEGSTHRWESDADGMRVALAAHDKVLRTAVDAHGGYVFSHSGDGIAAAFSSPMSAVGAAIDAQRDLQLPVRMGIATGEAELRDDDYFGTVLNRAARVMAAGHGGQVLVAESTAGLLSGVDLVDLGSRRLRDVTNPVTVFQLRATGLRTDFPPLRTLDPSPGNLRLITTSLIGRDAEVADVQAALRAHRLVTLTGVGGVGKTRLALEVASELAGEFVDGVWVLELAAVTDPAAVADAAAAVLGITQQPGKSVAESVAAALEGRVRLLVFDNCEHVLTAAADIVEQILQHSATVRILATSREGLGVVDEQRWLVSALDIDAAASLFVERAHSVDRSFSSDEADAAAEICRRLDGIPLAIELAASRMSSMTVREVNQRLDDRFRLLVGSRRGLDHHQTLRHAVQWSYDLLDTEEANLLERCSVFLGGFDLQSACAVAECSEDDEYTVLDLLDALVRKSLVAVDRSGGWTRYSMLETIRQFAEERLTARGLVSEVRTAHARYFGGREAAIMALWDSPRERESYAWFIAELPNLRTAFRWAADHDQLDVAAAIATVAGFVGTWVEIHEPTAWAEELVASVHSVDQSRWPALYDVAAQCYVQGRGEAAVLYCEEAHRLVLEGKGDAPYGGTNLGGAYTSTGQPQRWADMCREQLERGLDRHSFTTASLVFALASAGSADEAMALSPRLLEDADHSDNPHAQSFALCAYGYAWRDADPDSALDALRRGLRVARANGVKYNESILAMTLAPVEADHGNLGAALDCITLSISNYHDSGNIGLIRVPLAALVILLDRRGDYAPAARVGGFALSPITAVTVPAFVLAIDHLREALGDQGYDSLARDGESMTASAMASYAYDQIDRMRAELERSS
jgi:predicted ATPase/class 3 adenylate cyclase